jgi:hypothetical protein
LWREGEDPVKTEGARSLVDVMIEIPIPWNYSATQFSLSHVENGELFNLGFRTANQVLTDPQSRATLGLASPGTGLPSSTGVS